MSIRSYSILYLVNPIHSYSSLFNRISIPKRSNSILFIPIVSYTFSILIIHIYSDSPIQLNRIHSYAIQSYDIPTQKVQMILWNTIFFTQTSKIQKQNTNSDIPVFSFLLGDHIPT